MATFDFLLLGSARTHRLELDVGNLDEIAVELERSRFLTGDLQADEWGLIRRALIRSDRVLAVVEAE